MLVALGKRYLHFCEPVKAYDCFQRCKVLADQPCFEMSMLEWRHGFKLLGADVLEGIFIGGEHFDLGAQCRLFDLLHCQNQPSLKSSVIGSICYRHLAAPSLINSAERDFYRGAALYTGTGCQVNQTEGLEVMAQAVKTSSPDPAFRLAWMVEKGFLPEGLLPDVHPLDLFAEKACDLTPDVANQLLFSLGVDELSSIVKKMRVRAGSHFQTASELRSAATCLNRAIQRWTGLVEDETQTVTETVVVESDSDKNTTMFAREEQLIEELSWTALFERRTKPGSSTIFDRLRELRQLQGDRFPGFDDKTGMSCAALIQYIPMNCEEGLKLVTQLYPKEGTGVAKQRILTEMLSSFYLDDLSQQATAEQAQYIFDLIPDKRLETYDHELSKLGKYLTPVQGLPHEKVLFIANHGSFSSLEKLVGFADSFTPGTLEGFSRIIIERELLESVIDLIWEGMPLGAPLKSAPLFVALSKRFPLVVAKKVFQDDLITSDEKLAVFEGIPEREKGCYLDQCFSEGFKLPAENLMSRAKERSPLLANILAVDCGFQPSTHMPFLVAIRFQSTIEQQWDYVVRTMSPDMSAHQRVLYYSALSYLFRLSPETIGQKIFMGDLLTGSEKIAFFDGLPEDLKIIADDYVEKAALGPIAVDCLEISSIRHTNFYGKSLKAINGEEEFDLKLLLIMYKFFKGGDQAILAQRLLDVIKSTAQSLLSADKKDRDRLKYRTLAAGALLLS
jgi:hypothetical protein